MPASKPSVADSLASGCATQESSKALLVIGPSWVGDMVMAQCLFKLLKQQQPERAIDVMAPAWSHPLLERMPEVRTGIEMPIGHGKLDWSLRKSLGRDLQANNYQQVVVLPNSLKSALIPWFADIPKRTGWLGELRYGLLNDHRKLDKSKYPLMIERFCALALEPDAQLPDPLPRPEFVVASDAPAQAREALGLSDSRQPILALCPGAEFGPAKRWPPEFYGRIAKDYLQRDWQVWLFGSAKDSRESEIIKTHADDGSVACVDLTGRTSLGQAIDLLSQASAVVSNDSGLMHIAAALNRPLVVPYGSSSPAFTPPLGDHVEIVSLNLSCSPCFKRECPYEHLNCLRQMHPELVSNALQSVCDAYSAAN